MSVLLLNSQNADPIFPNLKNAEKECVICYDNPSDNFQFIRCGHSFHPDCINNPTIKVCPLCRTPLSEEVENNISENVLSISDMEDIDLDIGWDINAEENWKKKGFSFPEEDEDYDEENPRGDEWYYD